MAILHWKLEQGSQPWFSARKGIPTASRFDQVMTPKTRKPSASRKRYACQLIAERLMNYQSESLDTIAHIADGKAHEPFAIARLELLFDVKSEPIGFITTNDKRFGASPDRVGNVSAARDSVGLVVEAKSPTVPIQMERLLFGDDETYRCQRQGQMWVAEADKAIYISSNPMMPDLVIEDGRDEDFISSLVDCLERFSDELQEWELLAKSRGVFERYAEMPTPVEAELGPKLTEEMLKASGIDWVDDWSNDA